MKVVSLKIISMQLHVLDEWSNDSMNEAIQLPADLNAKTSLMREVFMLLGVLRSFGRYSNDDTPLICHVFPSPYANIPCGKEAQVSQHGIDMRR